MKIDKVGKNLSIVATIIFGSMTLFFGGVYSCANYVHMTMRDYYLCVVFLFMCFTTFFFGLAFFTELKE